MVAANHVYLEPHLHWNHRHRLQIFSHYINNGLSDMSLMLVMVLEMSHFKIIKTDFIPLVV